jgi:hypothetical protein
MWLFVSLLFLAGGFLLGHFTALHPDETRTFLERVRGNTARLFERKKPDGRANAVTTP